MASYTDLSSLSTKRGKRRVNPRGITFHHTASQHTNPQTIGALNSRGLASNFVMDRDGKIAFGTPPGVAAAHMKPSRDKAFSNSNMLGIEVSALNDRDITPGQVNAAKNWAADMGMSYGFDPGKTAFGHGELNAHKQATEGLTIANAVRAQHPQSPEAALTSPEPMATQFAPDFGMWGAPSLPGLTAENVATAQVTREQGPFSTETMPGAISPMESTMAPSAASLMAPSPTFSAPPTPATSPLDPNVEKAKQMLSGLSPLGPAPSFGAPPVASPAEIDAAKAALTAGLSPPQTVTSMGVPGLTDSQIGMGMPGAFGTPPSATPAEQEAAKAALTSGLSPQATVTQPTVSAAPSAPPSTFGTPSMSAPAPMSGMPTMPGALSPMPGGIQAAPQAAPQATVAAPQTQGTFGAPQMSAPAPMPMARPPGLMAGMPAVTVAAPAALSQDTQQATAQADPNVSVTAGTSAPGDFARAMATQTAAKAAAVNAAGPEDPRSMASKIAGALGFGGANTSTGGNAGMGGGSVGGSRGGSSSRGANTSRSAGGTRGSVGHGGAAQGSAHSKSSGGKRGTGAKTSGGR
jgi:hypothetical protein